MSFREVCIAGKCNNLITLKNGNIELILLDLGATIGRVAGRTKDAKVVLDGTIYYLEKTTKINILYTADLTVSHCRNLLLSL